MRVLGIGTDIIECVRIGRLLDRHGERFLQRVFTPTEIEYCQARDPAVERFAGRWAAKEAVLKSLGQLPSGARWLDLEIRPHPGQNPDVALAGVAYAAARQRGIARILVTLSHCRTHATATALAVAEE